MNLSTGISKAWRVISNHESVVQLLYHKHGQCGCNNHEKPQNYALTAFYPQSMCRSWISAVVDLWAGRGSGVVQDSSKQSMVWTKCNVTVGGLFREADMSFLVFAWSFIGILEHEFFICLWRRCGFYRR